MYSNTLPSLQDESIDPMDSEPNSIPSPQRCGNCDWLVTTDWHREVTPGSGYCTVHAQNRSRWMGADCPKWTPFDEF